mmetsp:Transcript_13696/g.26505  ORF Transcript_13696/g.26505 Transcript_13696/m.26505 type:complete len:300 (+) Transcript_13696:641-1540(+)|eukprot:CAMPEP_0171499278 /NCGR_PEP_ID=MMETSP0958-20121227/8343_1 /TAXON_ID=87120 /ORGANISM="Aurantiochytrium limacinum, Strain ATCCMYA-1381" /LENGTH=299 /DNA_ID=CAMNT_0012033823 /DNA_START=585 /DNA_END=1484 /DNA_ORIENTATION=+
MAGKRSFEDFDAHQGGSARSGELREAQDVMGADSGVKKLRLESPVLGASQEDAAGDMSSWTVSSDPGREVASTYANWNNMLRILHAERMLRQRRQSREKDSRKFSSSLGSVNHQKNQNQHHLGSHPFASGARVSFVGGQGCTGTRQEEENQQRHQHHDHQQSQQAQRQGSSESVTCTQSPLTNSNMKPPHSSPQTSVISTFGHMDNSSDTNVANSRNFGFVNNRSGGMHAPTKRKIFHDMDHDMHNSFRFTTSGAEGSSSSSSSGSFNSNSATAHGSYSPSKRAKQSGEDDDMRDDHSL